MLQEAREREEYISGSGYRCRVLHSARHGQDCSVGMVVYTNLEPTFDSPAGQIWVMEEQMFLRRFSEVET